MEDGSAAVGSREALCVFPLNPPRDPVLVSQHCIYLHIANRPVSPSPELPHPHPTSPASHLQGTQLQILALALLLQRVCV